MSSSSTSSISIAYKLSIPASVQGVEELSAARSQTFNVVPKEGSAGEQKAYYAALRAAIGDAKDAVGDDLTSWRDRVGKAELNKEPKARSEEDEEEDEEEEV